MELALDKTMRALNNTKPEMFARSQSSVSKETLKGKRTLETEDGEVRQMTQSSVDIDHSTATTGASQYLGGTHHHYHNSSGEQRDEKPRSSADGPDASMPNDPYSPSLAVRPTMLTHKTNSRQLLQEMPSSPFAPFAADIKKKSGAVDKLYRKLVAKYKRWLDSHIKEGTRRWQHRPKFELIRQRIEDSRVVFRSTSLWLTSYLSGAECEGSATFEDSSVTCRKLLNSLEKREAALNHIKDFVTGLCKEFLTRKKRKGEKGTDIEDPLAEFEAFVKQHDSIVDLDSFEQHADQLIKRMGSLDGVETSTVTSDDYKIELKKLAIKGYASAGLYQCLGQACPVPVHAQCGHTAHLSLQQEGSDEMHRSKLHRKVKTECHMAIKSTVRKEDSHIWLKVVSLVDRDQLDKAGAESAIPLLSPRTPVTDTMQIASPESKVKISGSKKRRRASTSTFERPSKAAKSTPGRSEFRDKRDSECSSRQTSAPVSDIQICMEYLAQDVGHDLVVMQMVDGLASRHRIYYLPPGERPRRQKDGREWQPLTLKNLLGLVRKYNDYKIHYSDVKWVVHVARLLAEAMLRFDRLTPTHHCTSDTVIFYPLSAAEGGIELEPFLEVNIERREFAKENLRVASDAHQLRQGRRQIILNLGLTLLQLALQEDLELDPSDQSDRDLIIERSAEARDRITPVYADVVRNCVDFYTEDQAVDGDTKVREETETDLEFRERFYHFVVYPLTKLDEIMQSGSF